MCAILVPSDEVGAVQEVPSVVPVNTSGFCFRVFFLMSVSEELNGGDPDFFVVKVNPRDVPLIANTVS